MSVRSKLGLAASAAMLVLSPFALADHREAEFVAENPKIDGTDLFVFRSYEEGREDFVTVIACYQPFQVPYSGPFCYTMDPDALYDIHVDKDGDGIANLTFRFSFEETMTPGVEFVGLPGFEKRISRPLLGADSLPVGGVRAVEMALHEKYSVEVIDHDARTSTFLRRKGTAMTEFAKAGDYFGERSFPDYEAYAYGHQFPVVFPNDTVGRVFVGPREDPVVFNAGQTYDLFDLDLVGPPRGSQDDLARHNVTALALEIPVPVLKGVGNVLGFWTTASLPQGRTFTGQPAFDYVDVERGDAMQVSRVGAPLVNSLLIGIDDKDRFNGYDPTADATSFFDYFTHPALPQMIEQLDGIPAPTLFPRADLAEFYLSGLPGLNETPFLGEMLRFSYDVPPVPADRQSNLGVLGGDLAGYPNGRRPGDDVVDITLRVLMGALLPTADAPASELPLTDGAWVDALQFDPVWPYLRTPVPGSTR